MQQRGWRHGDRRCVVVFGVDHANLIHYIPSLRSKSWDPASELDRIVLKKNKNNTNHHHRNHPHLLHPSHLPLP